MKTLWAFPLVAWAAAIYSVIQVGIGCWTNNKWGRLWSQFWRSALITLIGNIIIFIIAMIVFNSRDSNWGYVVGIFSCISLTPIIFAISLCFFGILLGERKGRLVIALCASFFLPVLMLVIWPVHARLLKNEWEIWDSALRYGAQGNDAKYYKKHLSHETSIRMSNWLRNMDELKRAGHENIPIPSDTLDILYQLDFRITDCPMLTEDFARKLYKQQYPRWKSGWRHDEIPRFASNESLPPDIL
ncbi:MAG: hypothetical protein LBI02_10340, partial [Opitutaceae bacterium]|nr:hypothetical protein [Opitutaceae bacterium]